MKEKNYWLVLFKGNYNGQESNGTTCQTRKKNPKKKYTKQKKKSIYLKPLESQRTYLPVCKNRKILP